MISANQIPYDVVRAAHAAYVNGGGNNILSSMENAIAAALNAWPDMCACLGSRCMAWRWTDEVYDDDNRIKEVGLRQYGYCGLAGRP